MFGMIFIVMVGAIIGNALFSMVSYDPSIRNNIWQAYPIVIIANTISACCWCYMARSLTTAQQFIANVFWDIGITLLFIVIPILMYNVRPDIKTIVGTVIAIIGLIVIKI
jgi:hypothetical protein